MARMSALLLILVSAFLVVSAGASGGFHLGGKRASGSGKTVSGKNCGSGGSGGKPPQGGGGGGKGGGGDHHGPGPHVKDDPHFLGAQGTRFEFNGLPGQSFCLFTDRSVHINMGMVGYLDDRTVGASVLDNGKAVRTWIGQLAIMWRVAGKNHTLLLTARRGKEFSRGDGFLASSVLDKTALPAVEAGQSVSLPGDLTLSNPGPSKASAFETDEYEVNVPGLFRLGLTLRAAHYLLRTPNDAMVHINVRFSEMHPTASVHGVMGQTYRMDADRTDRAQEFQVVNALLRHPVAADGTTGKGFLDGTTADYLTSADDVADCRFSAFGGATAAAA